jgi:hypothetical protein
MIPALFNQEAVITLAIGLVLTQFARRTSTELCLRNNAHLGVFLSLMLSAILIKESAMYATILPILNVSILKPTALLVARRNHL